MEFIKKQKLKYRTSAILYHLRTIIVGVIMLLFCEHSYSVINIDDNSVCMPSLYAIRMRYYTMHAIVIKCIHVYDREYLLRPNHSFHFSRMMTHNLCLPLGGAYSYVSNLKKMTEREDFYV